MSSQPEFLPRNELIALWTAMASRFNSELEIPVNSDISLVMKFRFDSDIGNTEISLKDLPGGGQHGSSRISTEIITECKSHFSYPVKISLPPLFPDLIKLFRSNVSVTRNPKQKLWLYCDSRSLRHSLISSGLLNSLDDYDAFYMLAKEQDLKIKTLSFLGREDQIKQFMNLHLGLFEFLQ